MCREGEIKGRVRGAESRKARGVKQIRGEELRGEERGEEVEKLGADPPRG